MFDYLATDDADSQNIVLKPVSSYEYLCNASCKYYLDGNTNRCYVLANDSPPRAGYCEQNYVPTFQSCTVGIETPAPLEHTPPADITTCPTNHTLNAFDVCIPDNISCPPDQAVNNQNICENVACQNGYERATPTSTCQPAPCPNGYNCVDSLADCLDGQYSFTFKTFVSANSYARICANLDTSGRCVLSSQFPPINKIGGNCPSDYLPISNNNFCVHSAQTSMSTNSCNLKSATTEAQSLCSQQTRFWNASTSTCEDFISCTSLQTLNINTNTCTTNSTSNGTGGDCTNEPEKCNLLTNIRDLLEGDSLSGVDKAADVDGLIDSITTRQETVFTTGLENLENWLTDSAVLTTYMDLLPDNPWQQITDGANGSCTYETQLLGRSFNFTLCEHQNVIHPLIAFLLFMGVTWGIFRLIFEKDNS